MKIRFNYSCLLYVLMLSVAMPLFAETPPNDIYGNYVGIGKCESNSANPCTDTGSMDTLYLQRIDKTETEMEKRIREGYDIEKHDVRVSIRILHDHGHKCTFKQDMYWAGDHLEFFPKAPYYEKICKLELWFKDDEIVLKDPDNACGCSGDRETVLDGRRFKKGSDPLQELYVKDSVPPPETIFGKYVGTGKCANDERKTELCDPEYNAAKNTDFIEIAPADKRGARIRFGRVREQGGNYYCLKDANAVWVDNHLSYYRDIPDTPGTPHILQFWFKKDTVVVNNVWSKHCGTYVHSSLFKKVVAPVARQK